MNVLSSIVPFLTCALAVGAFCAILIVPAWWAVGRLDGEAMDPFFRLLAAMGVALVGYLVVVNSVGRILERSIPVVIAWLLLNLAAGAWLFARRRSELSMRPLAAAWRTWAPTVALALVLGIPQALLTLSTPYWDETASSAIHVTAPIQFSEGIFPPRHNAFPDLPLKYHYGFTILSGTARWLTGLSGAHSIDLATILLWLFAFLFTCWWLRDLQLPRFAATWGAFTLLLGGGLAWLYLPRIEAYSSGGHSKLPDPSELIHRYEPTASWWRNVVNLSEPPAVHLRNTDGSLSNLPWDIAAQFQQHAVALGISLSVVALFLLTRWQSKKTFHWPLFVAIVACFSVLFLGHAVFGGVGLATAGVCLLGTWITRRTRVDFLRGLAFAVAVPVVALAQGGMLARGEEYGAAAFSTIRDSIGYMAGGIRGFIDWNVAGFGIPLALALVAGYAALRRGRFRQGRQAHVLLAVGVFAAFSYSIPQIMFYTSASSGTEEFTEITKFFFCTHFGLALCSVFGVAYLLRSVHWAVFLPAMAAMAIVPLAFTYQACVDPAGKWMGLYTSPYVGKNHIEVQMATAIKRMKKSPRDVYFDASADEAKRGYLSAMLIFGGSLYQVTPTRYERNGLGYRIAADVIAERLKQNGRMARLAPGSAEYAKANWWYGRPEGDMALVPVIVRSRFDSMVASGVLVKRFEAGLRQLYSIDKPTTTVDDDLERHWRARLVTQSRWNEDRRGRLVFYDHVAGTIHQGDEVIDLPPWAKGDFVQVSVVRLGPPGSAPGLLIARMKDTEYHVGKRMSDIVERNSWGFSYRDPGTGQWQAEIDRWSWVDDVPLIADLDGDGVDTQVAFTPEAGLWRDASGAALTGPTAEATKLPLPFAGRFLAGSRGDLGVWTTEGIMTIETIATAGVQSFKWGGRGGDVLFMGDWNGDGMDEIGVWQHTNLTFYWRSPPEGEIGQATFGTDTCVPIPADYDGDGKLDLAYWEPSANEIRVSFSMGATVDRVIAVPPHSIPAFVGWY